MKIRTFVAAPCFTSPVVLASLLGTIVMGLLLSSPVLGGPADAGRTDVQPDDFSLKDQCVAELDQQVAFEKDGFYCSFLFSLRFGSGTEDINRHRFSIPIPKESIDPVLLGTMMGGATGGAFIATQQQQKRRQAHNACTKEHQRLRKAACPRD